MSVPQSPHFKDISKTLCVNPANLGEITERSLKSALFTQNDQSLVNGQQFPERPRKYPGH